MNNAPSVLASPLSATTAPRPMIPAVKNQGA